MNRIPLLCCLVPLALLLTAPTGTTSEDIEGHWALRHHKPGVVEEETVYLVVRKGGGLAVTAEVSIPGVVVPFEGTFDPGTGILSLVARKGSESATIRLTLEDGRLNGVGDLPIGKLTFEGRRTVGAPDLPVRVQLDRPRPAESEYGDLPPDLARTCARIIADTLEEHAIVGLSVALVADEEVIDVISSGWQDHENDVPATARTMYRWASVTKPLTAVAALQLVESGELSLAADVRRFVPEYDKGVLIRVDQLLAHRSGIPHSTQAAVRTVREYDAAHPWTDRIVALDMFIESELIFPPGAGYAYSTPGYVLLGAVIERAGGQSYVEQVMERVCRPLDMDSMRPDHIWEEVSHRNVAYQTTGVGPLPTAWDDISWKLPAGGWISTVEDMGRFAIGLMGTELLDVETRQTMMSMHTDYGDGVKGYGLGISTGTYDGIQIVYHSGGQVGASSFLVCSPDSGHAVAVMSNTEGIELSDLALQMLQALMDSVP